MIKRIVVLSGHVEAGKSTISQLLKAKHDFYLHKTADIILEIMNVKKERLLLQLAGELLDRRTKGRWVADSLAKRYLGLKEQPENIVVDSVRIEPQIKYLREAYRERVIHVHLTALKESLAKRYKSAHNGILELPSYEEVYKNPTEQQVDELERIADIKINTDQCTAEDVYIQVASRLGLYGRAAERVVDVLVGGQYGSEGKGHLASYLSRDYDILVRVGGPNAGHKVLKESGPFTHRHLPSGTAFTTAQIVIGPGSTILLEVLRKEIADSGLEPDRLAIDPKAIIIEPEDVTGEQALKKDISSTGQGVGYATARKVLRTSAKPKVRLVGDVKELAPYRKETIEVLDRAFAHGKKIFLEGTQGAGLSLHHGHYPHVTSRDTTVSGCLAEAGIAPSRVRKIIMVCRSYPIRVHGAEAGPMSKEIEWKDIAKRSGIPLKKLIETEKGSVSGKLRRVSEFDWVLLRKATSLNGPTDIALTFADYIKSENQYARRFEQLTPDTIHFIEEIERVAAAPVSLIVTRFHERSMIDRRTWR